MVLQNKKKIFIHVAVLGVTVIFVLSVLWGYAAGKSRAEAETVAANAGSLAQGLRFFFADNNRFPTATEFAEANIMKQYFSAFPPVNFISEACQSSYDYRRSENNEARVLFCLNAKAGEYRSGWNFLEETR